MVVNYSLKDPRIVKEKEKSYQEKTASSFPGTASRTFALAETFHPVALARTLEHPIPSAIYPAGSAGLVSPRQV